ncbi:phosphatidylinositol phosphate synthase [Hamadaea tsunoensis]|uniref:phosphatidylinositol phosphate synthase n=1 Tax=Hamadaea tsunoensis TaxID=53368 RepID=UPI0003FFDB60|nr:CDP-alcohol phosphatidyltransferase family protein [Hamadaea tsunoensis]
MAKIFSVSVKTVVVRLFEPIVRGLLRAGVTPNAVTVAGTIGVLIGAIGFGARGHFIIATVVVTLSALTDVIDGAMARARGSSSRFGALLDSTMDRVADGAVFASVAFFYRGEPWTLVALLISLVAGQVVSYVKARADSLGLRVDVGLVERAERLILTGIGGLATGFGLGWGMPAAMWLLAAGSVFTVGQRMLAAARADRAAAAA